MKYSESLKKNKDFQLVYKQGTSYANKYLVMYVKENHLEKNRIGISVSKKVGNSDTCQPLHLLPGSRPVRFRMKWASLRIPHFSITR